MFIVSLLYRLETQHNLLKQGTTQRVANKVTMTREEAQWEFRHPKEFPKMPGISFPKVTYVAPPSPPPSPPPGVDDPPTKKEEKVEKVVEQRNTFSPNPRYQEGVSRYEQLPGIQGQPAPATKHSFHNNQDKLGEQQHYNTNVQYPQVYNPLAGVSAQPSLTTQRNSFLKKTGSNRLSNLMPLWGRRRPSEQGLSNSQRQTALYSEMGRMPGSGMAQPGAHLPGEIGSVGRGGYGMGRGGTNIVMQEEAKFRREEQMQKQKRTRFGGLGWRRGGKGL
ncbi:MAG: hypothetical protein Q9227_003721 [Pyrenula ochraceoflavens]